MNNKASLYCTGRNSLEPPKLGHSLAISVKDAMLSSEKLLHMCRSLPRTNLHMCIFCTCAMHPCVTSVGSATTSSGNLRQINLFLVQQYFDYIIPHCGLDLQDRSPILFTIHSLMMMHHHTTFDYKRLSGSEEILRTNPDAQC